MSLPTVGLNPLFRREGRAPRWVPGGRPRGDAPVNCMIIIILTIVGAVWSYYHFFYNRALDNAGKDIVISNSVDDAARNNYVGRMRDRHIPAVRNWGAQTRDACMKVIRGKMTDPEEIESRFNQVDAHLRELIGEVNAQSAPKEFATVHRQLAESIGFYWKALQTTREGLAAEEAGQQKRLYAEVKTLLAKGDTGFNSADRAIKAVTGRR